MWRWWLQIALSLPMCVILLGGEGRAAGAFVGAGGTEEGRPGGSTIPAHARIAGADESLSELREKLKREIPEPKTRVISPAPRQDEQIRIKERAIKRFDDQQRLDAERQLLNK